jgi:hypothetical protein
MSGMKMLVANAIKLFGWSADAISSRPAVLTAAVFTIGVD